jgi:hypothetical protein
VSADPQLAETLAQLTHDHPGLEIRVRQKASPRDRVLVWLLGSVVAGVFPIVFTFFHGLDSRHTLGFYQLLGKGDLLLIAIVLSVAGVAELVLDIRKMSNEQNLWVALLLLGNTLTVVADALWFGDLSSLTLEGKSGNPGAAVTYGSIALFVIAALSSSSCVWLSARVD